MPALTRRRTDNAHQETWSIFYGDVRVGTIAQRAGVPVDVDQWGWSCGFYPGLHPRQHRRGSAPSFEEARRGFEADWNSLLPDIPAGAFDEFRHDREFRAEIRAKPERGEKLDSEIPSSIMRCVCGVRFGSHNPEESYPHRGHIYAAQSAKGAR